MKRFFIYLIGLYQKHISPYTKSSCRFEPTCSEYAKQALVKRGMIVGSFLFLWRFLRCNPFGKGGFDPVPEKQKKTK